MRLKQTALVLILILIISIASFAQKTDKRFNERSESISYKNRVSNTVSRIQEGQVVGSSSELFVSHPKAHTEATLWVFSIDGKQLLQQKVPSGAEVTKLNLTTLETGMYEAIYIDNDSKSITKFSKL